MLFLASALLSLATARAFAPIPAALGKGPLPLRATGSPVSERPWALVFDCDGVLLESEGLHRMAYNKAFQHYGIEAEWTEEYYDDLQNRIGGGIPKMRHYFGEVAGWPQSSISTPSMEAEEQEAFLNTVQDTKTQMYQDFIAGGVAELRPGVRRLVEEAIESPERPYLAVCSASTKSSCLFVLDNLLGKDDLLPHFDLILAGDDVQNRKPAPDIYKLAAERLNVSPDKCLVVEDSLIGLQAAMGANMKCIITTTPSTRNQPFAEAELVVDDLDQGGVTLSTLQDLLVRREESGSDDQTPETDAFSQLVQLANEL